MSPSSPCVVLVPFAHAIVPECEQALRALERRGYPVWRVPGFSALDLGRCVLARDALAAGFEELCAFTAHRFGLLSFKWLNTL
jgi:hypothetical protein